jgi:DNA-binding XRE family transcriptional regulator
MTREELAQSLNCSQSIIYEWEKDNALPQLPTFLKLLNVFRISCEEFMKGVEIE